MKNLLMLFFALLCITGSAQNAKQDPNGTICIEGEEYIFYSIKEAIKRWRSKNPLK